MPVLPRLLLVGLRFSLPFLVSDVITYTKSSYVSPNTGYGLIGAFALVFISLAVSSIILSLLTAKLTKSPVDRHGSIQALYVPMGHASSW